MFFLLLSHSNFSTNEVCIQFKSYLYHYLYSSFQSCCGLYLPIQQTSSQLHCPSMCTSCIQLMSQMQTGMLLKWKKKCINKVIASYNVMAKKTFWCICDFAELSNCCMGLSFLKILGMLLNWHMDSITYTKYLFELNCLRVLWV